MQDWVYINELSVETLIGVYDFERDAKQTLLLDLNLAFDCKQAGQTDELQYALDYDALSRRVRAWSVQQTFELIERFAEQLCVLIHSEFGIDRIQLKINKPAAVDGCAAVGLQIERRFNANES
jgi:dihydroneopterin aldolase